MQDFRRYISKAWWTQPFAFRSEEWKTQSQQRTENLFIQLDGNNSRTALKVQCVGFMADYSQKYVRLCLITWNYKFLCLLMQNEYLIYWGSFVHSVHHVPKAASLGLNATKSCKFSESISLDWSCNTWLWATQMTLSVHSVSVWQELTQIISQNVRDWKFPSVSCVGHGILPFLQNKRGN